MERDFKTNNFDILRLFAATQVVVTHSMVHLAVAPKLLYNFLSLFPGVPIFFVISGFLISASYERTNVLKDYLKNRARRIYPALWVCITLTVPTIYLTAHIDFATKAFPPWFISQFIGIIYTPQFLSGFGFGSYNGSLWTIPIELQFYLILPLLYRITLYIGKQKFSRTLFLFITFATFCVIAYYTVVIFANPSFRSETQIQKLITYTFAPHIYLFLWGMILQRTKAYRAGFIKGKGMIFLIAYILFSYVAPTGPAFDIISNLLLGATTISLAYTWPEAASKLLKGNDISYGVYIYHGLILGVLVHVGMTGHFYYIIIVFVGACICGILSWVYIEKPILGRKKNKDFRAKSVLSNPSQ